MIPSHITKKQWIKYNFYLVAEHFIGLQRSEKYLRKRKNKLFREISQNNNIETRAKTYYNKDIECDSIEPFIKNKSALMKGPLLFKGVAKDWPCTKKWNKDFFRQYFPQYNISLVGNVGLADKENQNKFTEVSFKEFIDKIGKDKNNYLRFSRIIDENPALRNDLDIKWLDNFKFKFTRGGWLYLFMGEEGSKTDMHTAIIQSLFIQIKGKKKWTIYAPNERIFLDPVADRRPYYYTHANPNKPDDPNYPLLKYAIKYEIILDEGDVLWFPSYYWHYVENLTPNIGVTYKWTNFDQSFKISKVMTSLHFLATKPTIIGSFLHNTFKKRDLLFEKGVSDKG